MNMKIKLTCLLLCLLLTLLCCVGCKDKGNVVSDISSTSGSSVQIVVSDDEEEITQSELDEIINDWENNNPSINVEVDSTESDDKNSSSDGGSSSQSQESNGSSTDENSSDSSEDNSSDTGSKDEDDGYFDVAV